MRIGIILLGFGLLISCAKQSKVAAVRTAPATSPGSSNTTDDSGSIPTPGGDVPVTPTPTATPVPTPLPPANPASLQHTWTLTNALCGKTSLSNFLKQDQITIAITAAGASLSANLVNNNGQMCNVTATLAITYDATRALATIKATNTMVSPSTCQASTLGGLFSGQFSYSTSSNTLTLNEYDPNNPNGTICATAASKSGIQIQGVLQLDFAY